MNVEQDVEIGMWPEPATSGQHVGMPKGVKVTHKPTGIIVICDTERSQHANRQKALDFIARALEQREGFVMVPVEATDEMIEAAWDSDAADYVGEHKRIYSLTLAWAAMLAAAPKPEGSGHG